jgi:hypothetical protein
MMAMGSGIIVTMRPNRFPQVDDVGACPKKQGQLEIHKIHRQQNSCLYLDNITETFVLKVVFFRGKFPKPCYPDVENASSGR